MDLLNQRWNLRIVLSLLDGKKRFNELAREHGINPRTLRERLKHLEAEGVISRTIISQTPPNVEYALTEKGEELHKVFAALAEWGRKWMGSPVHTSGCSRS
jgi:DNA-binding HxlR family transcriptional regulator